MFVIGTAGHIDHGKSSMIMRLTGIDPDRLPEEKTRGMTIDLGFAYYDTPGGKRVGIIDVPGHERFVRNMIAGAGGINAVMLVIAADDGWMPQSQEHFQIVRLLGIKHGFVVLTKIDIAEESWVDLVEEDVREKMQGSFLADVPIVRLSSETGAGFDRLAEEIDNLAKKLVEQDNIDKPRLYTDRSFVLQGMGGIVAGTLRGGSLSLGQEVEVFPARVKGKIRTIQSHNQQVEKAYPGQRTAISLTGIDKEYLSRGSVITTSSLAGLNPDENILALNLELLKESPVIIENKRRLLLIVGTSEVEGEIRLLDEHPLTPGTWGVAFFRSFQPVLTLIGDRFIARLPTPSVTIGGGQVLDHLDRLPRKKEAEQFNYLKDRIDLTAENLVGTEIRKKAYINPQKDLILSDFDQKEIGQIIQAEVAALRLVEYNGKYYDTKIVDASISNIKAALKSYFDDRPHIEGLPADEIARLVRLNQTLLESILELAESDGRLVRSGPLYNIPNRMISISGDHEALAANIENALLIGKYMPPKIAELTGNDKKKKEAFAFLVKTGKIVKISSDMAFHIDSWNEIIRAIYMVLESSSQFGMAVLREKLGCSRKYLVPILEETDRLGITRRQGDNRTKGDNFEKAKNFL